MFGPKIMWVDKSYFRQDFRKAPYFIMHTALCSVKANSANNGGPLGLHAVLLFCFIFSRLRALLHGEFQKTKKAHVIGMEFQPRLKSEIVHRQ